MKSRCFKMIQTFLVAFLGFHLIGCGAARFSSNSAQNVIKEADDNNPNAVFLDDLTFISDSFERTDIFMGLDDAANPIIYGWRGFIDDGGSNVLGFEGNNTGMKIFDQATMGPAFDGSRALYMYGREGADIQTLYLVSQPYDLSDFNSVILSFRYLTFGLNDADDAQPEFLRLQVCKAGDLNDCGANADILDGNALKNDANWVTVFEYVPGAEDDALNGKNHSANDWRTALAVVDLNNPEFVGDKSEFVFRLVGRMRDGFTVATPGNGGNNGDCDCKCEHKHDGKNKDCDKHKDCKHKDCKDKNCKHKDCKNHKECKDKRCKDKGHKDCKNKCKCECKCDDNGGGNPGTPADGTLKDGIAIDMVTGIATQREINDIF